MDEETVPERPDSGKGGWVPRGTRVELYPPPAASAPAAGAPRRVQSHGATATTPEPLGDPEWRADLEATWARETAGELEHWRGRAAATRPGRRPHLVSAGADVERVSDSLASHEYAMSRVRSLAMSRLDIVAACGGRWRTIGCGCGRTRVEVGCDQPLACLRCSARHAWKWRKRITRGLRTYLAAERATWNTGERRGMLPGIYLLTLTVPHSGHLGDDRKALGDGWRRLYKVANKAGWFRTYAAVYELTPGSDGRGHVHMHVALISSWLPYRRLHEVWRDAVPGALVLDVQAPDRRRKAGAAANYLSKYVTKVVQPTELTGETAGAWLAACRGKRKVTTSRRFWQDPGCCLVCRRRFYLAERPPGLLSHAPGAVLRAQGRLYGPPPPWSQVLLRAGPTRAPWAAPNRRRVGGRATRTTGLSHAAD